MQIVALCGWSEPINSLLSNPTTHNISKLIERACERDWCGSGHSDSFEELLFLESIPYWCRDRMVNHNMKHTALLEMEFICKN